MQFSTAAHASTKPAPPLVSSNTLTMPGPVPKAVTYNRELAPIGAAMTVSIIPPWCTKHADRHGSRPCGKGRRPAGLPHSRGTVMVAVQRTQPALAGAGAAVGLIARSSDQLAESVELVEAAGGVAAAASADLGDPGAASTAVDKMRHELGPVDILVNNAGISGPAGPAWEVPERDWWRSRHPGDRAWRSGADKQRAGRLSARAVTGLGPPGDRRRSGGAAAPDSRTATAHSHRRGRPTQRASPLRA